MKHVIFPMSAVALIIGLTACNSNTKNIDQQSGMNHDSMSMPMDSTAHNQTAISSSMDKMMTEMHQMQMSGNVDNDFAMMMKGHHQGAVDMAQAELQSGQDDMLKQMAQKIIDSQKAEMQMLDAFLADHSNPSKNYATEKKDQGFAKVMDKSMMMMDMPKMDANTSTDQQFVSMMIPHHQSAVYMAEGFIQYGKDAKLLIMAKKMVTDQNKEIEEFKKWQNSSN
ncbi:MAG TPA: DUF305 domain-containing protein [Sphingobacteriaceae bacterium]|nr:DUF305 domain-containing protein [Sphingobacteriaceae bacterium]